jgi:hypothetical protein
MATRTWYLNEVNFGGANNHVFWDRDLSSIPSGINYTSTGWNVGRTSASNFALLENGSEVSRNTFSSTEPAATSSGTDTNVTTFTSQTVYGNCYDDNSVTLVPLKSIALLFPYNVVFEPGDFTFDFVVQANSRASGQGGRVAVQLFRGFFEYASGTGSNYDRTLITKYSGSSATLTWAVGTTVTNLTTTTAQTSSITYDAAPLLNPSSIELSGGKAAAGTAYLGCDVYWEITNSVGGSGANNSCDVLLMYGTSGTKFTSPNFRKRAFLAN